MGTARDLDAASPQHLLPKAVATLCLIIGTALLQLMLLLATHWPHEKLLPSCLPYELLEPKLLDHSEFPDICTRGCTNLIQRFGFIYLSEDTLTSGDTEADFFILCLLSLPLALIDQRKEYTESMIKHQHEFQHRVEVGTAWRSRDILFCPDMGEE